MVKKTKEESKEKVAIPRYKRAEGLFESVGTQNATCYIVVGGKTVFLPKDKRVRVEVLD